MTELQSNFDKISIYFQTSTNRSYKIYDIKFFSKLISHTICLKLFEVNIHVKTHTLIK